MEADEETLATLEALEIGIDSALLLVTGLLFFAMKKGYRLSLVASLPNKLV